MKTLFSFLLFLCTFSFCYGQSDWQHKVAPSLLEIIRNGEFAPILILLSEQANVSEAAILNSKEEKGKFVFDALRDHSIESQKSIVAFLRQNNLSFQPLYIVNAVRTEADQQMIQRIALRADVQTILSDEMHLVHDPAERSTNAISTRSVLEWGIERINADDVWALGFRGQGVVVGGGDTGYQWDHESLKEQYRGYEPGVDTADHNYNWHDAIHNFHPIHGDSNNICGLDTTAPCDDSGHGTHTMGTMVGLEGENQIGVAPDAEWCACRNMERGWGSPFTYLECFEWFLAPTDLKNENPDPSKAPHVINNSWGCPKAEGCDSSNWHIMNLAVENLRAAGIVVIVSAGNSGSSCSSISVAPAFFEGSFTVGAIAFNDTIAGFSSRGPVAVDSSFRIKPNVSAPGRDVRSARLGGGYVSFSGTSMAAPHVAGLVALMISANPTLAGDVEKIEDIIEQTSAPKTTDQNCGEVLGSEVPNNTYGYGRIDALAAVQAALALVGVEDNSEELKFKVYPNPVRDELIIDARGISGSIAIELFDAHGRILLNEIFTSAGEQLFTTRVDKFHDGIYFLRMRSGNSVVIERLIKQ